MDAEVRSDIERVIGLNEVGVQGVVNDEPASGGSTFRLRGSGERVSLAGMGVYPRRSGVGEWAWVSSGERYYYSPAPDFGSAVSLVSRSGHVQWKLVNWTSFIGMDFEPVFATTTAESSNSEVETVGRMARGENSRASGSSSSCSYRYS